MKSLDYYFDKNKKVGVFGISYLDEKLRGILQGDLILIGARPGAGKTTVSNLIAIANKEKGYSVSLFSLENFEGDSFIEKAYYEYMRLTSDYSINLRDFASGNFVKNEARLKEAEIIANKYFEGIRIIPRQANYDISKLKEGIIKEAEHGSKLIIIDHLDYVSKYSSESDNQHIVDLMRTIRNVQDAFKVAIVAISHLRKPAMIKDAPVIPSMDEFIGSSSKVKEGTIVIMLAPDDEGNMVTHDPTQRLTWCCIRKLRLCGVSGSDNLAAKLIYNTRVGMYDPKYSLYKVNYSGTKIEEIETNKYKHFAKYQD
jgi:replicative DNA helicase